MPTFFVDYENGNNDFAGTSFNVLASGTNGRITNNTFSSATASFPNNGTLCSINNLLGGMSERVYDTGKWLTTGLNNTTVNITPPSGITGNVQSLIENTNTGAHSIATNSFLSLVTSGSPYTMSAYVKSNGRNQIVFGFNNAQAALGIRYDLSTGTVVQSGASASGTITNIGDGWYRLTLTANATSTNQRIWMILTNDAYNSTGEQNYTGDGVSGFYICGVQLESGSSATAYEKSPEQYLSIFTGSTYAVYEIVHYLNSTSLYIVGITDGTGLSGQAVDRQYYIGGRWKNLSNGATGARLIAGDTIRIMGSPNPTPIGSGTWTGQQTLLSIPITSSTNASPISINCASTMSSLGITTGDTIQIFGHTTNTNANGTWEVTVPSPGGTSFTLNGSTGNGVGGATGRFRKKTSSVIRLASPVTANIASFGNRGEGRTAWTASSNVTATLLDTDTKEGDVSDSIAIGASFTTGKAAYKATGTLDLSGYQQISFWIKQTFGTVTVNGDISLRLCSDTTGDTTVHTVNIDGLFSLNSWTCIVINLDSNMNNSIKSVALYVDADRGAQTFLLSNIIACKAAASDDSLNLCSLISKNTTDEPWFPLMSINGTRVMLGNATSILHYTLAISTGDMNNTERGYFGTSETVTTYKRETISALQPAGSTLIATNQAGTISNRTKYEFGWDRTNMSTQNLVTYLDGRNGASPGFSSNGLSYIDINKLGVVRFTTGITAGNGVGCVFNFENAVGCTTGFSIPVLNRSTIGSMTACCNSQNGISINSSYYLDINKAIVINNITGNAGLAITNGSSGLSLNNVIILNNSSHGINIGSCGTITITSGNIESNVADGVNILSAYSVKLKNLSISNNRYGIFNTTIGDIIAENCLINQTIETFANNYSNARIHLVNHDNTIGNNFTMIDNGLIIPQSGVRYSTSGIAWALSPTNSTIRIANNPLDLKIATVAVSANSLVTVKAWMRRTNTGLTTGLRIKGGQIAGVPNDITSYMTAAADTWQQVTLTFTPTEIGVVEIFAECYGGSTFTAYVDDISITQV